MIFLNLIFILRGLFGTQVIANMPSENKLLVSVSQAVTYYVLMILGQWQQDDELWCFWNSMLLHPSTFFFYSSCKCTNDTLTRNYSLFICLEDVESFNIEYLSLLCTYKLITHFTWHCTLCDIYSTVDWRDCVVFLLIFLMFMIIYCFNSPNSYCCYH